MHLLNGYTEIRVRSSEGCTVLPCGCAHTDTRWIQMCDACYAEWSARHSAALNRNATSDVAWLEV